MLVGDDSDCEMQKRYANSSCVGTETESHVYQMCMVTCVGLSLLLIGSVSLFMYLV